MKKTCSIKVENMSLLRHLPRSHSKILDKTIVIAIKAKCNGAPEMPLPSVLYLSPRKFARECHHFGIWRFLALTAFARERERRCCYSREATKHFVARNLSIARSICGPSVIFSASKSLLLNVRISGKGLLITHIVSNGNVKGDGFIAFRGI
jgi:hypothetical protein